MGIAEILTLIFIVLKLVGIINWSWLLVLLPEIIAIVGYGVMSIAFGSLLFMGFKKTKRK